MASFEDEDAYLYDEEPQSKKLRLESHIDVSSSKKPSSSLAQNAASHEDSQENLASPADTGEQNGEKKNSNEEEKENSDEYEDDDDSDIEFIIDARPGQRVEAPQKHGPYSRVTTGTSTGNTTNTVPAGPAGSTAALPGAAASGLELSAIEKPSESTRKGIDLDTVGEWEGQEITEVSFDNFEDKPWREPGADITDYFNYGFDEITWAAYCSRQDNLRDFNHQKIRRILGANNPMAVQMMGPGMMPGFGAPSGFPGGFTDMMGMGMFPPGMPGFSPMGQAGNDDNGAYGGNVQGVAGVVANPHPQGHYRNANDGNNKGNYNNKFNQWNSR